MPRISYPQRHSGEGRVFSVIAQRSYELQRAFDVVQIEQRLEYWLVLVGPSRTPLRLSCCKVCRIAKQKRQQVATGCVRIDRASKASLDQQRQAPAMIDVRMSQQHSVDMLGIERKVDAITAGRITTALNKTTIDEQSPSTYPEDVAGSRYFTGRAEEFDFQV